MELKIKPAFNRDVKKIKDPNLKKQIPIIIRLIKNAKEFKDIPNCCKLIGYRHTYRIKNATLNKLGYRFIVKYEDGEVTVLALAFLKRKDVYEKKNKGRLSGLKRFIKICKKCGEKFTPERINIVNCKNCR